MFKALLAGAAAVAIARPIKESESFSAWKEEVSQFLLRPSRRQFQENVIKLDIYLSFSHYHFSTSTLHCNYVIWILTYKLFSSTSSSTYSSAWPAQSLRDLKRFSSQTSKRPRLTMQEESPPGLQE